MRPRRVTDEEGCSYPQGVNISKQPHLRGCGRSLGLPRQATEEGRGKFLRRGTRKSAYCLVTSSRPGSPTEQRGSLATTAARGRSATPRMSPDNTCAMPPGVKCGRRECLISGRSLAILLPTTKAAALWGHGARPCVDTRERSRDLAFLDTTFPWHMAMQTTVSRTLTWLVAFSCRLASQQILARRCSLVREARASSPAVFRAATRESLIINIDPEPESGKR